MNIKELKGQDEAKNEEIIGIEGIYIADKRIKCWSYWKLNTVLSLVSGLAWSCVSMMGFSFVSGILSSIVGMAIFYMSLVLVIDRLHDLGKSGWHLFFLLVPIYNIYLAILLSFGKGEQKDNDYGKYAEKQLVFDAEADKVFDVITKIFIGISILGIIGILSFVIFMNIMR